MTKNAEIQQFKFEVGSKEEANKIIEGFKTYNSVQWLSIPKEVFNRCSPEASLLYSHLLGFSAGLYRGSNTALANLMHCSTRTIARLLNELQESKCLRVVVVNRTTRLLYPVYTLPFIMDIESSSKKKKDDNGGFEDVDTYLDNKSKKDYGGFNVL